MRAEANDIEAYLKNLQIKMIKYCENKNLFNEGNKDITLAQGLVVNTTLTSRNKECLEHQKYATYYNGHFYSN